MRNRWKFLTVDEVLAIHRCVVSEFGGEGAVLNEGILESAVAMAEAEFEGRRLHEDGAAIAGAYFYNICRGHPFLDGKNRTALATAGAFLFGNGFEVKATQKELERLALGVAEGRISKDEVTAFLRARCKPARER